MTKLFKQHNTAFVIKVFCMFFLSVFYFDVVRAHIHTVLDLLVCSTFAIQLLETPGALGLPKAPS